MGADLIRHLPLLPDILGAGLRALTPVDISAGSGNPALIKARLPHSSVHGCGDYIVILSRTQADQARLSLSARALSGVVQTAPLQISPVRLHLPLFSQTQQDFL